MAERENSNPKGKAVDLADDGKKRASGTLPTVGPARTTGQFPVAPARTTGQFPMAPVPSAPGKTGGHAAHVPGPKTASQPAATPLKALTQHPRQRFSTLPPTFSFSKVT